MKSSWTIGCIVRFNLTNPQHHVFQKAGGCYIKEKSVLPMPTNLLITPSLPLPRLWGKQKVSNIFWGDRENKTTIFKALVLFLFSAQIHFKRLEMIMSVLRIQCWTNSWLGTFLWQGRSCPEIWRKGQIQRQTEQKVLETQTKRNT